MGFPIRKSPGQSLFSGSPELIAASHVLHRLSAPRHPLYALSNLTIKFSQDKKCRCFIVKEPSSIPNPNPWGIGSLVNIRKDVELAGIEPAASGLQNRRSPD